MFTPATEKLHRRKEIAQATEGKYLPFPTIMYMYAAFTPPTLEEGFGMSFPRFSHLTRIRRHLIYKGAGDSRYKN